MKSLAYFLVSALLVAREGFAQDIDEKTGQPFCGYTAINGLTSGRNNEKCGEILDDTMVPYNALYNGTLTLSLKGNAPACPENTYTLPSYTVGIGPKRVVANSTLDRSKWDTNPFYLWFKYQTNKNISAGFVSSSDAFLTESQWWTLTSVKSGDGFDITGEYTGKLAAMSNVYNYPTDACWTVNIYNHIVKNWDNGPTDSSRWTLKGRLMADKVDIVIDQTNMYKGKEYHIIFSYIGTPNPGTKGARLVTTEDVPTTDLALKGAAVVGGNNTADGTVSGTNGTANGTATGKSGATGLVVGGNGNLGAMSIAVVVIGVGFLWL